MLKSYDFLLVFFCHIQIRRRIFLFADSVYREGKIKMCGKRKKIVTGMCGEANSHEIRIEFSLCFSCCQFFVAAVVVGVVTL